MVLVNIPVPVPSVVLVDKAIVGFAAVLQQTPRAVTVDPPSAVMLPPLEAVVVVLDVIAVVVSVGNVATIFSKLISFWQLKDILANKIMQRKVFMVGVNL